jgi:Tol biopolymer transport system component
MRKRLILLLLFTTILWAQGTWTWSGRVHPELKWYTLETTHFNIHYHQGIEELAKRGASIAEQVWPTLLKQMKLDTIPKIDLTFTAEDEITNGYALWTNMSFIWVDQNDVAVWLEDEKWLYQVVAHELQHIFLFNATKTWLPEPWSFLYSGMPGWFVEGAAEYYTEHWRPYRADLSHKWHILKNKTNEMDPHHDGYSKLLYLSDRFGDSTIVNLVHYRNKLKLFDFDKGFKKVTGVNLKQFNEDWRRQMNTYYYGYRAQKETIEEVGKTATLPVKEAYSVSFAPDSFRIALLGRDDKDQLDASLFVATQDTSRKQWEEKIKQLAQKVFKSKKDTTKKKPAKVKWDVETLDYGQFHPVMAWSPSGEELVLSKYHFGKHQSMVWDLRVMDVIKGKGRWLTHSQRATQPDWSPDGERIVFVAHANNVSNLYTIKPDGSNLQQLTEFTDDTQILTPRWSPDGGRIAFAKAGPDGNLDIYLLELESRTLTRVTTDPAVDYLPIWHPDGQALTFTSHRGSTPNLHTVDLNTGNVVQNTDVGEALWGVQWTPKDSTILARTLTDVDTVRLVKVNPQRTSTTRSLSLRETFTRWRTRGPELALTDVDPQREVPILANNPYQFTRHIKHVTSLIFPYLDGSGAFGTTVFMDAMGRHIFELGGGGAWVGDPNPWVIISYVNAQHGPLWGINYFYNSRWNFRYYDQSTSGLYERLDGWQFYTSLPFNFGNTMVSNHMIQVALTFQNRLVTMPSDSIDEVTGKYIPRNPEDFLDLPVPEEGREGVVSFTYRWLSRRPHKQNLVLPQQGQGVLLRLNRVDKNLYGDFTYTKVTTDGFVNISTGGPTALYLRLKTLSMYGDPPAQEYVGLSNDPNLYLPGGIMDEGVFGIQENYNPRGWEGVRLGDRLLFGTLEYRFPLMPKLPINVLGLTLGSLSGALLSDYGNAWTAGEPAGQWVVTAGYELKLALQMEKIPLLIFSLGKAQTWDEWQNNEDPTSYARLVLINPF